jgi:hypothetical protein
VRELATERANFSGFARSVSVVSQNATLPVAFFANDVDTQAHRARAFLAFLQRYRRAELLTSAIKTIGSMLATDRPNAAPLPANTPYNLFPTATICW